MTRFTVVRIDEDIDFGCEERSADAPVMVLVTLRGEGGEELMSRQEDQMMYDRDINEGDQVTIGSDGRLEKC